jgi:hypothetical protein
MFHPHSYRVGDHVKLTRALANDEGTFEAGHEFEITALYERHGVPLYDLRDRDLNLLTEVPFEDLSWDSPG